MLTPLSKMPFPSVFPTHPSDPSFLPAESDLLLSISPPSKSFPESAQMPAPYRRGSHAIQISSSSNTFCFFLGVTWHFLHFSTTFYAYITTSHKQEVLERLPFGFICYVSVLPKENDGQLKILIECDNFCVWLMTIIWISYNWRNSGKSSGLGVRLTWVPHWICHHLGLCH